jgi:TonB-linked SusC/RagA family outer membrane protein
MMKKTFKLFFSLLCFCHVSFAQNITVTGKVTTPDNEPVFGVSIKISGSKLGTVSDAAGVFTIAAPAKSTLIVSHVGFNEQLIPLNGRSSIAVILQNNGDSLQAVVVTALGIKKDVRRLGYATATVNSDQVSTNRTPNVMSGLQGKMSGVNISTMGTGPAGSVKVRIRGQSSFSSQNSPLIVINGVPMDNTTYGIGGGIGARGGQVNNSDGGDGLSSINPDDIESMTVLKGATASALYGSRSKDGVIMITTKNKASGKGVGLDYNVNYTTDTPLDYTDFQYEYGQGERGVRPTTAYPQSGVWSFGEKFQPGMTQVLFDGKTFPYEPVYNRYKKFYRTGTNLTNTVTLATSGDKGGLSLSLSNTDNKGILPNSKFNRKSVNLGFTQNVTSYLNVSGNVNYSNEQNTNPPQVNTQDMAVPTVLYTLANSMPFYALEQNQVLPNGNEFVMARFLVRNNPYYSLSHRRENIQRDRVIGNVAVRYQVTPWLYAQGRIAQDFYTRYQDYNIPNGYAPIPAAPPGFVNGSFTQDIRRFRERNYDFLLGGNHKFQNFGIDITLGGNQMYRKMEYNSVLVTDFIIPGLYTVMNGRIKDPFYGKTERKVNSLYGAAEFSYRNFLFVSVTARNDWFSTLAPANRSILYTSVNGSFVFSDAFSTKMPSWLSFGKLRLAYAEVGDDNVAAYSNVLYYSVNNNLFPNPSGAVVPIGGISGSQIPNPDLRPLRVSEKEAGIELKFFNNRVGLDFTYYHKITRDQILGIQVSEASSYTNKLINVGRSMNQGVEMMLSVSPVKSKSFQWDVTFNGSYNTSKVLQLGPNAADTSIAVSNGGGRIIKQVVGKPIGALYTYMYLRDKSGQQVFDKASGKPLRNDIPMYAGNVLPRYFGGITNSFNYKGILLSLLIDYKLGAKMIAGSNQNALRHGLQKRTLVGRAEGYVIGNGVNQDGGKNTTKTDIQPFYETPNVLGVNEDWVFNSGFWKLRQITLGYDFTRYVKNVKFIKGVKLSAVANNVAIIKKWTENMDPENTANISDNETGLDFWTAVPPTRSIGFNLSIKF